MFLVGTFLNNTETVFVCLHCKFDCFYGKILLLFPMKN
jgi:hypothetical protein